jgi:hypothetical protein
MRLFIHVLGLWMKNLLQITRLITLLMMTSPMPLPALRMPIVYQRNWGYLPQLNVLKESQHPI